MQQPGETHKNDAWPEPDRTEDLRADRSAAAEITEAFPTLGSGPGADPVRTPLIHVPQGHVDDLIHVPRGHVEDGDPAPPDDERPGRSGIEPPAAYGGTGPAVDDVPPAFFEPVDATAEPTTGAPAAVPADPPRSSLGPQPRPPSAAGADAGDGEPQPALVGVRFGAPGEEAGVGGHWRAPHMRGSRSRAPQDQSALGTAPAPGSIAKPPRRPAAGLAALVVLALLTAFFAWVSAEPLWLAVGHGDRGTATVTRCTGSGVAQRCVGRFTGERIAAEGVALRGVAAEQRQPGSAVTAEMVAADSQRAYVDGGGPALHLRWAIGLLLLVLCGFGIAAATGARRLENEPARRRALIASVTAPFLLLVGFLAATY